MSLLKDLRTEGLARLPTCTPMAHSRPVAAAKGFQSSKLLPVHTHPPETGVLKSHSQLGGRADMT